MAADFSDETPIGLLVLLDHGSLQALIDNAATLDTVGGDFSAAVKRGTEQLKSARDGGTTSPQRFIPWTRTQQYLDECIVHWRRIRDDHSYPEGRDEEDRARLRGMATYYIDAMQSVRTSLLGELLP